MYLLVVVQEDSNQSALSASATPGASRVIDSVIGSSSAPASPLSLLLQTAPKPPELHYAHLAQPQHSDLPDVSKIAALIDDGNVEMKQVVIFSGYIKCNLCVLAWLWLSTYKFCLNNFVVLYDNNPSINHQQ